MCAAKVLSLQQPPSQGCPRWETCFPWSGEGNHTPSSCQGPQAVVAHLPSRIETLLLVKGTVWTSTWQANSCTLFKSLLLSSRSNCLHP